MNVENDEVNRKRGRTRKPFDELSENTKRQNAKKLRTELSTDELGYALEKCFKKAGYLDASKVVKKLIENPATGRDFLKTFDNQSVIKMYTPDEAIALTMDMKLSKRQYDIMRFGAKKRDAKLYPSYNKVLAAKKRCYPPDQSIVISDIGFKIDLQAILDLTAERLVATFPSQFDMNVRKLRLVTKYGFDGASNQSRYKQKFQDPDSDDSSIFISMLVPIVLYEDNRPEIVHWQNKKPSSTTYCRPLRLEFKKETKEYSMQIYNEINDEIKILRPTMIRNDECSMDVTHELHCTMVDGKICNYLSETKSSLCCFICKASSKELNDLDRIYGRPKQVEFYKFGLSTLHAWIRFMDCVLHVSYNMKFKKWSTRKVEHKIERERRKKEIQEEFRKETGLKVDYVLQGKGNSNDGNTARRFFKDHETTARITGFNVLLLKRFAVILQTMASGREIDVSAFSSYTRETASMFVQNYAWFYMPITVHKILIHGADVIQHAIVPIGQLSEEVQESRHKEVRQFRQFHSRKMSRTKTNEDMLHNLLISSDPYITANRTIADSKKLELLPECNDLFMKIGSDVDED